MDESFDWLRRELDATVYSGAVAGFVAGGYRVMM